MMSHRDACIAAVFALSLVGKPFTIDEVWEQAERIGYEGDPDNDAMGSVMNHASRKGWATKTNNFPKSQRRVAASRRVAEWVGTL